MKLCKIFLRQDILEYDRDFNFMEKAKTVKKPEIPRFNKNNQSEAKEIIQYEVPW